MRRCLILALCSCTGTLGDSGPTPTVDAGLDSGGGSGSGIPEHYRFTGRLTSTATVPFGGSPYCDYAVTLRDVVVDVVLREDSYLVNSLVTDTMVEQALNGCPHQPAPPNAQVFEYTGSPLAGASAFQTALEGRSSNAPETALELAIAAPSSALPTANVRWTRTDQGPPLGWTVSADNLELSMIPCMQGAAVCVGRDAGTLYTCTDGVRLRESKRCAAGCASSTSCN